MAVVRIETNVPDSNINESFFVESTESLASTFRKPKSVSIHWSVLLKLHTFFIFLKLFYATFFKN